MRARGGFTLLEICLAVFIALLLLTLAVPSLSGLLADQKMRRSFDRFDELAHEAQSHSLDEQRAFVIARDDKGLELRARDPEDTDEDPVDRIDFEPQEIFAFDFPAALAKKTKSEWTFWPTGTCEPAVVTYHGAAGSWTGTYNPLTVRADFSTL